MISMVSLQESKSPNNGSKTIKRNLDSLSNKRKSNDDKSSDQCEEIFRKRSKSTQTTKSVFGIELQLETPLPLEWQRCLDIQSGKIHFYNTRTQRKTSMDPRQETTTENNDMSLELELNLPCQSQRKKNNPNIWGLKNYSSSKENKSNFLEIEDDNSREEEMVAIVCEKCHLLVMLCKSFPSCPNCKFMHSTHLNSPHQLTLLPSCATYL